MVVVGDDVTPPADATISLATKLRSINEKFRSRFNLEGGGGVLAT